MRTELSLLALLLPLHALADDLCEPRESLRKRVNYCHENFEYIPAAATCTAEFKALVAEEQKRLKGIFESQLKEATGSAQNENFHTSDQVLRAALDDLTYLIDYGKQVHTEIEDYGYALVLPIYDEEDETADWTKPEVQKVYMERECYGDPVNELEKLELSLRPMIQELEDTKKTVTALMLKTEKSEAQLKALAVEVASLGTRKDPSFERKKFKKKESTITGEIGHHHHRHPAAKQGGEKKEEVLDNPAFSEQEQLTPRAGI